jgi:hypothetical protein
MSYCVELQQIDHNGATHLDYASLLTLASRSLWVMSDKKRSRKFIAAPSRHFTMLNLRIRVLAEQLMRGYQDSVP